MRPGERAGRCARRHEPEPGITLVPSCTQVDPSGCTPGGADPGAFAVKDLLLGGDGRDRST
jgi:hypothetical protein